MRRTSIRLFPAIVIPLLAAWAAPACSSTTETPTTASSSSSSASGTGGGSTGTGGSGGTGGTAPDPTAACKDLGFASRPFADGPYGTHRGDVAADFTLDLADGTSFHLKDHFSGCDSYLFIPDVLPVSDLDPTSIWENKTDLRTLLEQSPKNVHFFFVSRTKDDAQAKANIQGMQARVDEVIGALTADEITQWKGRVHVLAKKATDLGNWVGDVLGTHGRIGFSIDRRQIIRGAGDLADVKRFDQALDDAMKWPWKWNLAYAQNDPKYFNAQSDLLDKLDAEGATVVDLWKGETLMELADTTVKLPDDMSQFDTFEVEVTQQCPNPDEIELGNCGAWDYIAQLYLADDPDNLVELARFITSYHRETHWVADVSSLLPLLASGGQHAFRWSFAPSWNTQPTATKLSLRFSNQKKGMRPKQATYLFSGGGFGSMYNVGRAPVDVPIPATAKKVELFVIVTGHGAGTSQCSEFCNHQHEFTINGTAHKHDFPLAGTQDKCMPNITKGMTPNQAGTWWFGRGGWCPGQQVDPWVLDVTSEVTPGQTATVSYRGLFKNIDPPPDGAGDINMVSYLVVHE
ncbi:MAG: peptide-N-glycosidase F-related protein [Minicystis sp.]